MMIDLYDILVKFSIFLFAYSSLLTIFLDEFDFLSVFYYFKFYISYLFSLLQFNTFLLFFISFLSSFVSTILFLLFSKLLFTLFFSHYEQSEIWVGRGSDVGAHLSVPSVRGDKVSYSLLPSLLIIPFI